MLKHAVLVLSKTVSFLITVKYLGQLIMMFAGPYPDQNPKGVCHRLMAW